MSVKDIQFYIDDLSGLHIKYMSEAIKQDIFLLTNNCTGGMRERLYWLRNKLKEYPTCIHCNQVLSSKNFIKNGFPGYRNYCSIKCAKQEQDYSISIQKRTITNKERYGSSSPWHFENFRKFMKEQYGVEYIEVKSDN